jgi:hypothetical protein
VGAASRRDIGVDIAAGRRSRNEIMTGFPA